MFILDDRIRLFSFIFAYYFSNFSILCKKRDNSVFQRNLLINIQVTANFYMFQGINNLLKVYILRHLNLQNRLLKVKLQDKKKNSLNLIYIAKLFSKNIVPICNFTYENNCFPNISNSKYYSSFFHKWLTNYSNHKLTI